MLRPELRVLCVSILLVASACATSHDLRTDNHGIPRATEDIRRDAIARARVWRATDVAARDLRAGPAGKGAVAPFADVHCDYVEKKMTGASFKFTCALEPGDEVKIKYGADNYEVFSIVAASRLLWALGFGADRWYPVRVVCRGCPWHPARSSKPMRGETAFDVAAMERPFGGRAIETRDDEGWGWDELGILSETADPAERDALRLLAVFLQHSDNKSPQQRLVCQDDTEPSATAPERCGTPFMYLHDVGLTFGRASAFNVQQDSSMNFENWSKKEIWDDKTRCVGNLSRSVTGTLGNPVIHEAGRKFLADLLGQLTDRQLRDLFEVARFPQQTEVTAEAWIAVFKAKRAQIVDATCQP